MNIDKAFIATVSKHTYSFLLIALILGNVYQYIDRGLMEKRYANELSKINEINRELVLKTLEYERNRAERIEYLLNSLSINKKQND